MLTETDRMYFFTLALSLAALLGLLQLGLLPALLAGLLVFHLVEFGADRLGRHGVIPKMGRIILLVTLSLSVLSLFVLLFVSLSSYLTVGPESVVVLLKKMADVVDTGRNYLPLWAQQYLPENLNELQLAVSDWLRKNAVHLSVIGGDIGMFLVHILIGMIIGGMVALHHDPRGAEGPLAKALRERVAFLGVGFRQIVFSQVRISALNTTLTGIFLAVILPLTGNPLPFTKAMIVVTFVVGLLPIVGNLISNTVIFLIGLSVSPMAAFGILLYLIFIHKLEYFVNARIIGNEIKAHAWELLVAMLVMETAFGIAGMVAAPIYYAYLKAELASRKLI